jgi:threonine dehydrogenase-like Zn-dependent dehydrogenase
MVTDPNDCVVRVTSTTICGSDLHLYHKEFEGLPKGFVLGHEPMGIVESVGTLVKDIKVGDRVVVSAVLMEGQCWYCKVGISRIFRDIYRMVSLVGVMVQIQIKYWKNSTVID